MTDFEKLGAFYLGRVYDAEAGATRDELLLYDSKDLTTHALCVGMTGSGKTGLCVTLLEEAAIDGIPALIIDPKGDLGNLFLTFPKLRSEDFLPWVDPGEASRKGQTLEEYATRTAALWKKGLADWGQDGKRIQRFRDAVDLAIYTPGSSAGRPLRVLRSFTAPSEAILEDGDAMRERVQSAVSGLLSLLDIEADPIRSREHILLSNLVDRAWREGRDLELSTLIAEIQSPPFERLGVLDLESFFPSKERFELAMILNNLLASPGFSAWMEGEPLDIGRLLYTPEGKPRVSVLSIAHLGERERMFFVTLLLNEVVSWMRAQSGTSSLRALLYMDEVFGYFPPTANPPSKTPMLTLLKQARAYGLGVVLATQNPVDLDYKGLANCGTWFLGRLQTERDKARVLDGLEGASANSGSSFNRAEVDRVLSGLSSRVFLMNNVHDDHPELFHTRWALSYLRGPLTRKQIRELVDQAPAAVPAKSARAAKSKAAVAPPEPTPDDGSAADRPLLPPGVPEVVIARRPGVSASGSLVYRPALLGRVTLHYASSPASIDCWRTVNLLAPLGSKVPADPWAQAQALEAEPLLDVEASPDAKFATLPAAAAQAKNYTSWKKRLKSYVYREHPLRIGHSKKFKCYATADETASGFRARLAQVAREKRDLAVEKLKNKYAPKLQRIRDRIRSAEERLGRERDQHRGQKMQTAVSIGATVLGALFGRKVASVGNVGRATTAARGAGRIAREAGDVERAQEKMEIEQEKLAELEEQFEDALAELSGGLDPATLDVKELLVRPRKTDISIENVALAWTPWIVSPEGIAERAF